MARNNPNHKSFYKLDLKTGEIREVVDMNNPQSQSMSTALSPDGKTAYAWPELGILAAFDLTTGKRQNIYSTPDATLGLALSPDGRQVAFTHWGSSPGNLRGANLYVINVDENGARDLLAGQSLKGSVGEIAWSVDNRWLYFVRSEGGNSLLDPLAEVWRVSANGGTPEYTGLSATGIWTIDMSRDGTRLIYGAGFPPGRFELWALDNLETAWKPAAK
jgi:Tol biopolymer transport system component